MPQVRRKLVVGNWKLHGSTARNEALLLQFQDGRLADGIDVAVCPPFTYLQQAVGLLAESGVSVGAQDVSAFHRGAYTGEISGEMLVDLGCSCVIVGHSERRSLFGDTDPVVARKVVAALETGLPPILCVGETQSQRESGLAEQVVAAQLESVMACVDVNRLDHMVVAYEPIWAIGTGLTATPEQAQVMHVFIRRFIESTGADGQSIRILYGGSVNSANAASLFDECDIDGALVGGASLDFESFRAICAAASGVVRQGDLRRV